MSPVFYCLDDSVELDVICAVTQAWIGEIFTEKGDGTVLLA